MHTMYAVAGIRVCLSLRPSVYLSDWLSWHEGELIKIFYVYDMGDACTVEYASS